MRVVTARGHDGHASQLWVAAAAAGSPTIVLFHGDISDTAQTMQQDESVSDWTDWSLERLSERMTARFPCCHTVVVGAARREACFACYDQFLPPTDTGDPKDGTYDPAGSACRHLEALLDSASEEVGVALLGGPLHLLAFSKGCAALNQCLAELGAGNAQRLVVRLESLVWLDPGLSRMGPVFVTDELVLHAAARRLLDVHNARGPGSTPPRVAAAFTPRQLADREEPWVGTQYESFQGALAEAGLPVRGEKHFFWRRPSLEAHFRVLCTFRALEGSSATRVMPWYARLGRRVLSIVLAPTRW